MIFKIFLAALFTLATALTAARPCKPTTTQASWVSMPSLPSTGSADLSLPPPGMVLKKVALGHGIQNYSCPASDTATPAQLGALAALYDVTSLYPGTPRTGLNETPFNALSTILLWSQSIPLNLVNTEAAWPGTTSRPNVFPESSYGANTQHPFLAAADINIMPTIATIKFLGHHYFDQDSLPTFDLLTVGLKASVVKNESINAPLAANKGIIGSGAIAWLKLVDSGRGVSNGLSLVYRVITAGGAAEPCRASGAGNDGAT
ncbi:hypothetical protein QBC46DRAFT_274679 [Diplogelasinospora grovesii]|uniref:Malate dehydrogenase n=1 Tax=Diplogelasinospora grovesii TaxID=303347 RepID=A0AAN6MY26_9PEZI|nr:hypothetical protein QBC46DRAFT_274679 [Diplogelasinospora grovesii]